MANRRRPIILRCPVTVEERTLIEQKMAQLQTKRIGAYLRKMAIDGYIIQVDTRDIKLSRFTFLSLTIITIGISLLVLKHSS